MKILYVGTYTVVHEIIRVASLVSHIHCRATAVLKQKKEVSVCKGVCLCVCFAAGLPVQDDEVSVIIMISWKNKLRY